MTGRVVAPFWLGLAGLSLALAWGGPAGRDPAGRAAALYDRAVAEGRPALLHDAARDWRAALARAPGDALAWTGLAWTEAARGGPPAYVDRLMARARVLAPDNPTVRAARAAWQARDDWLPPAAPAP